MRPVKTLWLVVLMSFIAAANGSAQGPPAAKPPDLTTAMEAAKKFGAELGDRAERGDRNAQHLLGTFAEITGNYATAAQWYQKAAEQGLARAQADLGNLYRNGAGVPQDYVQAFQWSMAAAVQGDPEGQFNVASMYSLGQGRRTDDVEAMTWARKAAVQDCSAMSVEPWFCARAQGMLGAGYLAGRGVPQDYVLAYMWANLSASSLPTTDAMYKLTADMRADVAKRMTPEQIAEAQQRARAWTPSTVPTVRTVPASELEPAVSWRRAAPAATAIVQLTPQDRNPSPAPNMFDRSAAAVVDLRGSRGTGTAFVITRDGLALTNHHVVNNQAALRATLKDGRDVAVRVLRSDSEADVALIQINCSRDCFTIDTAHSYPKVGTEVLAIGNPLTLDFTLTRGIVSGLRLVGGVTLIQTDAALNPGNSGGPIIDAKTREVVAIASSKITGQAAEGLGFGVAISDALRVLGIQWQ